MKQHNWVNENPGMRCSVCHLGWWGDTSERNLPECGSEEAIELAHWQLTIGRQKDQESIETRLEKYNQTSSGRWDASGSWSDAVAAEHEKARSWALRQSFDKLSENLIIMANDPNAFTTYERRALMLVVADMLAKKSYW